MGFSERYEKYLSSPEWRSKRERIFEQRDKTCEICGKKLNFIYNVHHKNYKRLGEELDTDLMLLCEVCHYKIHNKKYMYQKHKDKTKWTCPSCLNKVSKKSVINSGTDRCPRCNAYINRKYLYEDYSIIFSKNE